MVSSSFSIVTTDFSLEIFHTLPSFLAMAFKEKLAPVVSVPLIPPISQAGKEITTVSPTPSLITINKESVFFIRVLELKSP